MTLDEKLEQIEDTVYGANWRNLIAVVRKAVQQRNSWIGESEGGEHHFHRAQEDDELLAILENLYGDPLK